MTSKICKAVACRFLGKCSGKAVCRAQAPKRFIKHLDKCPQTL